MTTSKPVTTVAPTIRRPERQASAPRQARLSLPFEFQRSFTRRWLSRWAVITALVLLMPGSASAGSTRSVVPGNGTAADKHAGDGRQARQQDQLNLEIVGTLGGPTEAVDVAGDLAYIGIGRQLAVVDIADPTHPQLRGQTRQLPDNVQDIHVVGNHAYVAGGYGGNGGLRVIDVSDPTAPRSVGAVDTPDAMGVDVVGDHVYVADQYAGLRIIDMSIMSISDTAPTPTPVATPSTPLTAARLFMPMLLKRNHTGSMCGAGDHAR